MPWNDILAKKSQLNCAESHSCEKSTGGRGAAKKAELKGTEADEEPQFLRSIGKLISERDETRVTNPAARSREPVRARPAEIATQAHRARRAKRARRFLAIPQYVLPWTRWEPRSREFRLRALHR